MRTPQRTWIIWACIAVALVAAAFLLWRMLKPGDLPDGIVGGNGRIEAVEIDVAAKAPGAHSRYRRRRR
jgi:HlyD family secretion protein